MLWTQLEQVAWNFVQHFSEMDKNTRVVINRLGFSTLVYLDSIQTM